jgi:hypothetical protein
MIVRFDINPHSTKDEMHRVMLLIFNFIFYYLDGYSILTNTSKMRCHLFDLHLSRERNMIEKNRMIFTD